ncbi:MAG: flagellar motor switch phosphatase FliY [Clostridiales bacterium]|nr:flagellar motor switch phosphatase FliY [Clostridiales bacterium]
MEQNNENILSPMDVDTIGEVLNISLGSSATTVSTLLDQRVNITTPRVEIIKADEFNFQSMEPAVAVEINYVSGLDGKNIMILKESDVKIIVGLLLQTDYSEQEFTLDEMSLGAICEVMNQMMGASSTALSQLLNRPINISPPKSFQIENSQQFKEMYFQGQEQVVAVYFRLMIGELINSEFISLMSVELAKKLIASFGFNTEAEEKEPAAPAPGETPEKEIAAPVPAAPVAPAAAPPAPPAPAPAAAPPAPPAHVPAPPAPKQPEPRPSYEVRNASYKSFDQEEPVLSEEQSSNLNMIMSVPLEITVEIGRTTKKIQEILDFSPGTIVELDKQAGSQVDVFVNGKAVAKGDVVVVDEYFGVRITEISSSSEIMKLL